MRELFFSAVCGRAERRRHGRFAGQLHRLAGPGQGGQLRLVVVLRVVQPTRSDAEPGRRSHQRRRRARLALIGRPLN